MTKEEYLKKCCEKCSFSAQGCCYVFRGKNCHRLRDKGLVWDAAEKATIEKFRTAMEEWCNSMSVIDAHDIDEIIDRVKEEDK